jgi:hypothetical protein
MILRRLTPADSSTSTPPPPASPTFIASQTSPVPPPFAVVLQIAHSRLTGELARRLLPSAFGELPVQAIEAAWKHDLGWAESDQNQLNLVPNLDPKPFPLVAADDELPSWIRSLTLAESYPPLTRVLISRHFTTLANQPTPQHEAFLSSEEERRQELEDTLDASPEDLERWTGAVGFCDLLSLYLCSGLTETVTLPLAHPADPEADDAPQVTLSFNEGQPTLSQPVFQPGTQLRAEAQRYTPETGALSPLALHWTINS